MKIAEEIEKLAAQESEVRRLEMLIERLRSLNDRDFAKLLSGLSATAADTVTSGLTERGRHPPGEPPLAATEAAAMLLRRFTSLLKSQPAR